MIKLLRLFQSEPKLRSTQIHGLLKFSKDGQDYVFETLERPWRDDRKEFSSLKKGTYKYTIVNQPLHYAFIQLQGTGRRDNKIQVFRESPIWFGTKKVFNTDSGLYEFTDFREVLRQVTSLVPENGLFFIGEYDAKANWNPNVPETTTSYFKTSDDELLHLPTPQPE